MAVVLVVTVRSCETAASVEVKVVLPWASAAVATVSVRADVVVVVTGVAAMTLLTSFSVSVPVNWAWVPAVLGRALSGIGLGPGTLGVPDEPPHPERSAEPTSIPRKRF